jgi:Uma2 family endonuclease
MVYQPPHVRSARDPLPTMYDLPSENPEEPGLPDEFHDYQPQLLRETFRSTAHPPEQVLIGTDLNLYYDARHPLWYKRPDWFVALGVDRAVTQDELRLSYLIWQEGVSPYLVVELLSPGTEAEDLGQTLWDTAKPPPKWEVYSKTLRVPYYIVFDRYTNFLRGFRLEGTKYIPMDLPEPRIWLDEIGHGIGVWQGDFEGIEGQWLRFYDKSGAWVLSRTETTIAEKQRANAEKQLANSERQRANTQQQRAEQAEQDRDRLAAKLRELGIDPGAL